MIGHDRTPATRQDLLRARRRLERVSHGASLLRRRREALARELIRLARPAIDVRSAVARESRAAYDMLLDAMSGESVATVHALGWPTREVRVDLRVERLWGVNVAEIADRTRIRRDIRERGHSPAGAGPLITGAADRFESLVDLLLDAAPREVLLRRLGDALARTSRQVQTLEHRMTPALERTIAAVRDRLEQREREDHHRLKHFAAGRREHGQR